jgi:hypothetical protein
MDTSTPVGSDVLDPEGEHTGPSGEAGAQDQVLAIEFRQAGAQRHPQHRGRLGIDCSPQIMTLFLDDPHLVEATNRGEGQVVLEARANDITDAGFNETARDQQRRPI